MSAHTRLAVASFLFLPLLVAAPASGTDFHTYVLDVEALPLETVNLSISVENHRLAGSIESVLVEFSFPDGWSSLGTDGPCAGSVTGSTDIEWAVGDLAHGVLENCLFRVRPDSRTLGDTNVAATFTWTIPMGGTYQDTVSSGWRAQPGIDLSPGLTPFSTDLSPGGATVLLDVSIFNDGNSPTGDPVDVVLEQGPLELDRSVGSPACGGTGNTIPFGSVDAGQVAFCQLGLRAPAGLSGQGVELGAGASYSGLYPELFEDDDEASTLLRIEGALDLTVDTLADGVDASPGDGFCRNSVQDCSLRAAIQEANAWAGEDRIRVEGTLELTSFLGMNDSDVGDLDVLEDLEIAGPSPGSPATLLGLNNTTFGVRTRVLEVPDDAGARLTLRNLVIAGGEDVEGGGVRVGPGNELVLTDVTFFGNATRNGGEGGGLWARSPVTATDVVFEANVSDDDAGGLSWTSSSGGELHLERARFEGNEAVSTGGAGGAIHLPTGSGGPRAFLVDSTIVDNLADLGGGLSTGVSTWLVNTTVSGNRATSEGGGLRVGLNTTRLAFSTVAANSAGLDGTGEPTTATGEGGGIWVNDLLATVRLDHSVVGDNEARLSGGDIIQLPISADCFGTLTSDGFSAVEAVTIDNECAVDSLATDHLNQDFGLEALDPVDHVHRFGPSSVLADGGDTTCDWDADGDQSPETTLLTDQLGGARPAEGDDEGAAACDPGAWERGAVLFGLVFEDGFESGDTTKWGP